MLPLYAFGPPHRVLLFLSDKLQQRLQSFTRARLYRIVLLMLLRTPHLLGAEGQETAPVPVTSAAPAAAPTAAQTLPGTQTSAPPSTTSATPDPGAPRFALDAQVVEAGSRKPLAEALIELETEAGVPQASTRSNDQGQFSLPPLPAGAYILRLQLKGYESRQVNLTLGPDSRVPPIFYLRQDPESQYVMEVDIARDKIEVLEHSFSMEEVRSTPGAFGDAIRATQNLPGMARAPFGLGLLIVRGTGPNDTGTFFNGLQVPIIFHFGGLISVYSSSILDRISYLPGGYSVRYGRNLGGVIDVDTKTDIPEQTHGYADINLMDSAFYVETKVGSTGLSLAARRSYIDVLANPLLENSTGLQVQLPRYWDFQLKADTMLTSYDALQLSATASDDRFAILGNSSEAQNENEGPSISTFTTTWRARASWTHFFNTAMTHRLDVAIGPDEQNAAFGVGEIDRNPFHFDLRSELQAVVRPDLNLKAGLDFQSSYYTFDLSLTGVLNPIETDDSTDSGTDTSGDSNGDSSDDSLIHQEAWNFSPSPYLEAEWTVGNRLKLIPGLRVDPFWIPDNYFALTVDPRISARLKLTEQAAAKGSIGQYSQFGEMNQLLEETGTPELLPANALQSTLGFELDFTPRLHLDVVGYYNYMSNLVVSNSSLLGGGAVTPPVGPPAGPPSDGASNDQTSTNDATTDDATDEPLYTNDGLGRSYGLEVLFRQDSGGKFYGWLSYSLSRSERKTLDEEDWHLYQFDQTHVLTLVGALRLPRQWELSARYRFASGNPYTPTLNSYQDLDGDTWVSIQGEQNSARNDYFSQLDLRFQKDWIFNTWKLQGYLDIQNVTNRANPEITIPNFDYRDSSVITSLPFLPVLGFRGSF